MRIIKEIKRVLLVYLSYTYEQYYCS